MYVVRWPIVTCLRTMALITAGRGTQVHGQVASQIARSSFRFYRECILEDGNGVRLPARRPRSIAIITRFLTPSKIGQGAIPTSRVRPGITNEAHRAYGSYIDLHCITARRSTLRAPHLRHRSMKLHPKNPQPQISPQ